MLELVSDAWDSNGVLLVHARLMASDYPERHGAQLSSTDPSTRKISLAEG